MSDNAAALAGLALLAAGILLIIGGCVGADVRRAAGLPPRHRLRSVDLVLLVVFVAVISTAVVPLVVL